MAGLRGIDCTRSAFYERTNWSAKCLLHRRLIVRVTKVNTSFTRWTSRVINLLSFSSLHLLILALILCLRLHLYLHMYLHFLHFYILYLCLNVRVSGVNTSFSRLVAYCLVFVS